MFNTKRITPLKIFMFILLYQVCTLSYAVDYQYREVKDIDELSSFESIEEFEAN